jgi:hypothetical protein
MPKINDRCITIFQKVAVTVLESFTVPELADLETIADKIDAIIKQAQQRQQERIEQA